jgi:predicted acyl esterase
VPTGKVTRFDIEVFPTFAELRKGHRLRFTLTSSDSPHVLPTIPQQADLAGGVYRVQRNAAASSYLEIPMARADAFARCRGRLAQIFHYTSNVERPRVDCR